MLKISQQEIEVARSVKHIQDGADLHLLNGEWVTVSEACSKYKRPYWTIWNRMFIDNMTLQKAWDMSDMPRQRGLQEVNGELLTVKEVVRRLVEDHGVKTTYATVWGRLKKFSLEEIYNSYLERHQ